MARIMPFAPRFASTLEPRWGVLSRTKLELAARALTPLECTTEPTQNAALAPHVLPPARSIADTEEARFLESHP